jgi:hypothetical protein
MIPQKIAIVFMVIFLFFLFVAGCDKSLEPSGEPMSADDILHKLELRGLPPSDRIPPSGLVNISVGSNNLEFWPYTGENFTGSPQDPVNLIFYGKADPRQIMAALLSLDGDRSAFGLPPVPPFNMTWQDAIGDVQAGYGTGSGWVSGAVQLACGDYGPVRFHLRLFKLGAWTVGNAHFEVQIEGTTDHQVLSWELAEQFVIVDFMRSGLLDESVPIIPTAQINDSPFRTIPAMIYNLLPPEIRDLIGGPIGDVVDDVPIATDGHAVIFNLAESVPVSPDSRVLDFVINFNQVIPMPFCSEGGDYVYVNGPVHLVQTVSISNSGTYTMQFRASGDLSITPVNPITGEPIAPTLPAMVRERHTAYLSDNSARASSMLFQIIDPESEDEAKWIFKKLRVGENGNDGYMELMHCGEQ